MVGLLYRDHFDTVWKAAVCSQKTVEVTAIYVHLRKLKLRMPS